MTTRFLLAVPVCVMTLGCQREATAPPAAAKAEAVTPADTSAALVTPVAAPALCPHGVPAEVCTKCDPDLEDVFKEKGDWCGEHGVPESHCKQCNPALDLSKPAAAKELYCGEHGVPEAMCTKCKPQLVAKYIASGDYCREHGLPESVCPFCHPEVARAAGVEPPVFPPPGLTVRLARPEIAERAGLTTAVATEDSFADPIEVVGQIDFDQNRLARLSVAAEAVVSEVKADVGDPVRVGQPLVLLTSAKVGEAQARRAATATRLENARAALAREEALLARSISSRRDVEDARSAVASAEQEHQSASAELRAAGASGTGTGGVYSVRSPIRGVVVARHAAAGQAASPGQILIEVADLATLWAVLDVPEEHAGRVRPGQKVLLRFDRGSHPDVTGQISRVAAAVDKHTRTVRVRVEVPNPTMSLRAGLFVRARIDVGDTRQSLFVPQEAIQRVEGHDIVFVRTGSGIYKPRAVEVRPASRGRAAVLRGLDRGADVVVAGAFLLKTEMLKDSIGAGCADDH